MSGCLSLLAPQFISFQSSQPFEVLCLGAAYWRTCRAGVLRSSRTGLLRACPSPSKKTLALRRLEEVFRHHPDCVILITTWFSSWLIIQGLVHLRIPVLKIDLGLGMSQEGHQGGYQHLCRSFAVHQNNPNNKVGDLTSLQPLRMFRLLLPVEMLPLQEGEDLVNRDNQGIGFSIHPAQLHMIPIWVPNWIGNKPCS